MRAVAIPFVLLTLLAGTAARAPAQTVPTPSQFVGFEVGADRQVADYRQIRDYLRAVDAASGRVEVRSLGKTTLGEDMIDVLISSEANLRDQERIRDICKRLADPRGATEEEIRGWVAAGKAIVIVTCNIHSDEIASSQMAMEWTYALATAQDPETLRRLDNVVLVLVPSLNPDGQILETEWYRKHLGTPYEGGDMPWLYHHYVGHDDNRDWFMLTQKETRHATRLIYHEWLPQIFVDEHQMGSTGPRMFVPPFADPVDPDIHPLIWREIGIVGATMALRLEQAGKAGVIHQYLFDAYWLGATRNTGWWKNITGLLLETASARFATPVWVDPTELSGGGKGLIDYRAQVNHPNPWKGGWWRLRDIIDYERIASDALLEVAADKREDLLWDVVRRAQAAVQAAAPGEAYRIPRQQRDRPTALRLAQLLADHGVEVIEDATGDFWVPLAQPYGHFVREMLEPQRYPEVRLQREGRPLAPYDVATWTLPLMMGVAVEHTEMPAGTAGRRLPHHLGEGEPATVQEAAAIGARAPRGEDPGGEPSTHTAAGEASPRHPSPAAGAGMMTVAYDSPEAIKVINAALRAKGGVSFAPVPDTSSTAQPNASAVAGADAGEGSGAVFCLDAAAARAAESVARAVGVDLVPAAHSPAVRKRLRAPRVAIYKPWDASMDEGWTRWLLEQYGFEPKNLDNKTIQGGKLAARFDAIILPDVDKEIIATGKRKVREGAMRYTEELPPEYRGGLDKSGSQALVEFVQKGGTLIALASATEYVIQEFNIPVHNALASAAGFDCPGSLVRLQIPGGHPVTAGLPHEIAGFLDTPIAFATTIPGTDLQRWVLASYPEDERDILLSGWISGASVLERHAAAVALTYGKGKIVLFGFRPQFRAQTHATFPMLFNALYWSVLD